MEALTVMMEYANNALFEQDESEATHLKEKIVGILKSGDIKGRDLPRQ